MRQARIFRKGTKATQCGRRGENLWVLQAEPLVGERPDPVMGWAGGGKTSNQVNLYFPTREAAEDYARRNDMQVQVMTPHKKPVILQSYADNFLPLGAIRLRN